MIRWKVEPWIDRAPTHSRYIISTLFGGKVTIFSLNKSKHLPCIPRNVPGGFPGSNPSFWGTWGPVRWQRVLECCLPLEKHSPK